MNHRPNSDLAAERQAYADRQTRMVQADGLAGRRASGQVDVTFQKGEVVRLAGIDEAEAFVEFLESTPPEQRSEAAVKQRETRGNSPTE